MALVSSRVMSRFIALTHAMKQAVKGGTGWLVIFSSKSAFIDRFSPFLYGILYALALLFSKNI
jgi:hypothetical protein